jgi:hypothetical protein
MTTVGHDEIRELLGVYALDAVEPEERDLVERHLATCAECREEVDRHRSVAAMLAASDLPAPEGLWDRVKAGVTTSETTETARVVPLRRPWAGAWLSAAAVVTLLALVGLQTVRLDQATNDLGAARSELAAVRQALATGSYGEMASLASGVPGSETVSMAGDAGDVQAIILPDGTGILVPETIRPLDPTRTYQLWAVIDGKVISAGVLGATPKVTPFHIDRSRLEGLVLTNEEAGGVAVSEQAAAAAWFAS